MIKELLEKIKDYEMPYGTEMNEVHIERWLNQFNEEDRNVILSEMIYLCKNSYFSRKSVKKLLKDFFLDENVWRKCTKKNFKNMEFLNIQEKGDSQAELLDLINEILNEEYQLDITECNSESRYVYIDDCIFTGSRLKWDIKRCIENGEIKENSKLMVFHICKYKSGDNHVWKELEDVLEEKNISLFKRWYFLKQNYQSNQYCNSLEILWPKYIEYESLERYIETREEKSKWAREIDFFRDYDMRVENLFSCAENREIVERAFLKAGVDILDGLQNPCDSMRPMGFSKLESIGFGAIFITYRNIANNCPLALWYGDISNQGSGALGRWYPLFPRTCNDESEEEMSENIFDFDF